MMKRKAPCAHKDLKQKLLKPAGATPFPGVLPAVVVSNTLQLPKPSSLRQSQSANEKATEEFLAAVQKLIDKEGYTLNYYYYFYKTSIYYEHMPQRTYTSKTEKHDSIYSYERSQVFITFL